MQRAVAGGEREQREGASGKWVAHWKMVHIVRPVWEKTGQANQLGRAFPPLTYTDADAAGLTLLEPAPRTVRGARDLLSVAIQYGNAFGQGMQAAALKPADFFGNDDVLYLMEDMATGEIRLSILWEWLHKSAALHRGRRGHRREGGRPVHRRSLPPAAGRGVREAAAGRQPRRARQLEDDDAAHRARDRGRIRARPTASCPGTSICSTSTWECTAWQRRSGGSSCCVDTFRESGRAGDAQPRFRADRPCSNLIAVVLNRLDDLRITQVRPLLPPAILLEEIPITERASDVVAATRQAIADVLTGHGPAPRRRGRARARFTTPKAALEYARRLLPLRSATSAQLIVTMRSYFEKPRTSVGWKGLINDPDLDESFHINKGLRLARKLLVDLNDMGLPTASEFLDTQIPQYIADLTSWVAIGARTTESQVHRELASGLSMPVGFKNGTDGSTQTAVDAVLSARSPHLFPSVTKQGVSAIFETSGNDTCHVILRGGIAHRPQLRRRRTWTRCAPGCRRAGCARR